MAIGYAPKDSIAFHSGHDLEVAVYGVIGDEDTSEALSATIECMTCGCVLIDSVEDTNDNT